MDNPEQFSLAGEAFPTERSRAWAEIDLSALLHNLGAIRKAIGPRPEIMAVVKADAYGHGAARVAEAIAPEVDAFGAACLEEAMRVRHLGRETYILSPCLPWEREEAVAAGLIPTVSSAEEALAYARHGACRLNFKIDTGMGRIGCPPGEAAAHLERISREPALRVRSVASHLPSSDEDPAFTQSQLEGFERLRADLSPLVPGAKWHALNSAGIFGFPGHAMDMVRAGLALYGSACPGEFQPLLLPALAWKTRVVCVRDLPAGAGVSYGRTYIAPRPMRMAVLSVGYADGFPRQAAGRGACALIGGRRRPLLGRPTMDQIIVDVSDAPETRVGDEAVLIGRQGSESLSAAELAAQAGTISWHIFTGLGERVHRRYVRKD